MNLFELTEDWCRGAKMLQHQEEKNERFFLCDGYMGMADFMRGMENDHSPSVIMDSNVQGALTDVDQPYYTIYFAVKADEEGDGRSALEAKLLAKSVAMQYINYLRWLKKARRRREEEPSGKTEGTVAEASGKTEGTVAEASGKTEGTVEEPSGKTEGTVEEAEGDVPPASGSRYTLEERKKLVMGLELSRIQYNSVGPFYNGWEAVYIDVETNETFNECLNENDYIEGWI